MSGLSKSRSLAGSKLFETHNLGSSGMAQIRTRMVPADEADEPDEIEYLATLNLPDGVKTMSFFGVVGKKSEIRALESARSYIAAEA